MQGASSFYNAMEGLINRLGSFFCSRYQNKLVRPANWMEICKVNCVHVMAPFEKTDRGTAVQILSGASVPANLAYASRQQNSGRVIDTLHEFFDKQQGRNLSHNTTSLVKHYQLLVR